MIYKQFKDKQLSALGFGTMRLPVLEDGSVNETLTTEMVRYAMEHGVNYFDTAYPYHGGMSEVVVGKALADYPRDSFYLATKYPGHQISVVGFKGDRFIRITAAAGFLEQIDGLIHTQIFPAQRPVEGCICVKAF